jgi:hypothetical protein
VSELGVACSLGRHRIERPLPNKTVAMQNMTIDVMFNNVNERRPKTGVGSDEKRPNDSGHWASGVPVGTGDSLSG